MPPRWWRQPIPSADPGVASFAAWLRVKRALYVPWLISCAVGSLLVPITMHVVDARFAAGGGWDPYAPHALLGAPWWLVAWLFALLYIGAMALLAVAFEALVYFLRLDRGDHAWSSMTWSLRGWGVGLAWSVLPLALVMLVLRAALVDDWWVFLPFAGFFPIALILVLPLFVLTGGYVSARRPAIAPRPQFPGGGTLLLWLGAHFGPALLAMAVMQLAPPSNSILSALFVTVLVLARLFLPLIAQLRWLNPRDAGLDQVARAALRPRVFLPWVVQSLRWQALLALAFLAAYPAWWFLTSVFPQLQDQLLEGDGGLMPLIRLSRFATAWWWAVALCVAAAFQFVLVWFTLAGKARMLFELGEVRQAVPEVS